MVWAAILCHSLLCLKGMSLSNTTVPIWRNMCAHCFKHCTLKVGPWISMIMHKYIQQDWYQNGLMNMNWSWTSSIACTVDRSGFYWTTFGVFFGGSESHHQHHTMTWHYAGRGMAQNLSGHSQGLASAISKINRCCIGCKRMSYTIQIHFCGLKPGVVSPVFCQDSWLNRKFKCTAFIQNRKLYLWSI